MIDETKEKIIEEQERAIIKCCIDDRIAAFKAIEDLSWKDFYGSANSRIFKSIEKLNADSEDISIGSIRRVVSRKADLEILDDIVKIDVNPKEIEGYVNYISEQSKLRRLYDVGNEVRKRAHEEGESSTKLVSFMMQEILDAETGRDRRGFVTPGEIMEETIERLKSRTDGQITGHSFGIPSVDSVTGGANEGNLVIIAGRPQMGKTALALQMAAHLAFFHNIPVPFFSLEMSRGELMERIISNLAQVAHWKIKKGMLGGRDWEGIDQIKDRLNEMPLYIEDVGGCSLGEVIAKCKRLKIRKGTIGPVFIDYLQLADLGDGSNRDQSIGKFTRGLKRLAKDLSSPIIALSQLSRKCEERENKRPILSDLRESGNIEQDADIVIFVYRDFVYTRDKAIEKEAEVDVAKNRHGRVQRIVTEVDLDFQSFRDFEKITTEGDI